MIQPQKLLTDRVSLTRYLVRQSGGQAAQTPAGARVAASIHERKRSTWIANDQGWSIQAEASYSPEQRIALTGKKRDLSLHLQKVH
jgi:hypothetical protein